MKDFRDKIAVITGAGSGMGKELALQLCREGAHVAICDIFEDTLHETERQCRQLAAADRVVLAQRCDVADEAQVLAFRDAVLKHTGSTSIELLINNAGIGGGGSFITDSRENWDRTFDVCFGGVYNCTRAFLPLMIASKQAVLVNVSSVNGFFAAHGDQPHSAYSTAKFAVKGFTEGLYTDLRCNAPHVKVVLVMPGHVGTSIVPNTLRVLGFRDPTQLDAEGLQVARGWLLAQGVAAGSWSDDQVRTESQRRLDSFRASAPLSAADAALIILDGVRNDRWRVLVGNDAKALDEIARTQAEQLYEPATLKRIRERLEEERKKAIARRSVPA